MVEIIMAHAGELEAEHMPMMGMFGMTGMGSGAYWFFTILFVCLIALVAGILIMSLKGHNQPRREDSSALDILKERYAKGEIDEEEYNQKYEKIAHS